MLANHYAYCHFSVFLDRSGYSRVTRNPAKSSEAFASQTLITPG
jgi:hypothetical protein